MQQSDRALADHAGITLLFASGDSGAAGDAGGCDGAGSKDLFSVGLLPPPSSPSATHDATHAASIKTAIDDPPTRWP